MGYDPFSVEVMTDPYPVYRELRARGPVIPLPPYDAFALTRFDDVWRVLTDIKLSLSLNQLRRELSYLRDLGLIELEGEECDIWFAKLTAQGVDVVEYTTKAPAGVARPRKYW